MTGAVRTLPRQTQEGWVDSFALSDDGRRVLTIESDNPGTAGQVRVWDAETGAALSPPIQLLSRWASAHFSPDGRRLVATHGESGRTDARVWDVDTGKLLTPRLAHEAALTWAGFSPDGGRVLTASNDGTARAWDAATGEPITPPLRHGGPVSDAYFSRDGRRVITVRTMGAPDRGSELRVWDAATGQPLVLPLRTQEDGFALGREGVRAGFSRNGDRVVLREHDTATVYDLTADPRPVEDLLRLSQVLGGRRVSAAGSIHPLEAERLQDGWREVRARHAADWEGTVPEAADWHGQQLLACKFREDGYHQQVAGEDIDGDAFAAVWHVNRLLALGPATPQYFAIRAAARAQLRQWPEAVADYTRAIEGKVDGLWPRRGQAYAELGNWEQAAQDFEQADKGAKDPIRYSPEEHLAALALVRLRQGDLPRYRDACAKLLEMASQLPRGVPAAAFWPKPVYSLWPVVLSTEAMDDFRKVWATMGGRREHALDSYGMGVPVGLALIYRAQQYKEAAEELGKRVALEGTATAADWLFLAMAQKRLGQADKARASLARGAERMKDEAAEGTRAGWQQRLAAQILHREAKKVVNEDGQ
jgi:tetratricopeptide (TPR) repeat protein